MKKSQKRQETESDSKKVEPSLYRYRGGKYYGLVKHKGKKIRHSFRRGVLEALVGLRARVPNDREEWCFLSLVNTK